MERTRRKKDPQENPNETEIKIYQIKGVQSISNKNVN